MAGKSKISKPQSMKKKNKQNLKSKSKTHIINILIVFVSLINLIYSIKQFKVSSASVESPQMKNLGCFSIQLCCVKKKSVLKANVKNNVIFLLLILSNDVHPNPGPKRIENSSSISKCYTCKLEIEDDKESLKCSTCQKIFHITCQMIKNLNRIRDHGSFEWICTTKKCPPNHQQIHINYAISSQNRYSPLYENEIYGESEINYSIINDCSSAENEKLLFTHSEVDNMLILQELPKISPKDYEGKSLCRVCHKEVKDRDKGISCDKCDMWSHLKCSDVSSRLYKNLMYLNNFNWTCIKCRLSEPEITAKIDIKDLDVNTLPADYENVKQQKNETLILNINCRSLIKKREELEHIIEQLSPTFICLTETWLDGSVSVNDYVPEGYKMVRHDRTNDYKQKYAKNNGGGVAILYRKDIKIQKVTSLTDPTEEILWVRVKTKFSFLLGVVYRASYTDTLKEDLKESPLEENIRKASEMAKSIILVGDFNVDYANKKDHLTEKLENACSTNGLSQLILKPTRIDPSTSSKTIIDHIWINNEYVPVKTSGTMLGLSDHLGTYVKIDKVMNSEPRTITYRNYKNYEREVFNSALQKGLAQSDIDSLIENSNVNLAMERLTNIIVDTLDCFAPMCEKTININFNPVPWFNKELRDIISRKNSLLKDLYQTGLQTLRKPIKILNNQIVHLKRKLKKEYLIEKLTNAKNDAKENWKILNSIVGSSNKSENIEPDHITQEKADSYNHFFATIGEEILKELKLSVPNPTLSGCQGFSFSLETETSISKLIDQMKPEVATGRDRISAKVIKDAKHILVPILTRIINISYRNNIFPDCMKKASITPIYKKDDSDIIANYRPISILPCLSKIIEQSASNQLIKYLEDHNLLSRCQNAYRKKHGTQTCLFQVINCIQKYLDEKELVAIVSLDLSKAFDAINHDMLLQKLIKLGLSESALCWIKSYLSNRKQCTKFSKYTSKDEDIKAGVPQGSILGPLLFICFSNDIYEAFEDKCEAFSYADDSQLILHSKNQKQLIKKIEEIIKVAHGWYSGNCMKANQSKTEILIVNNGGIRTENMKIKILDEGKQKILIPSKHIKVLGVKIDENLSWEKQILNVKKTASNTIRKLHRINHLLPIDIKIQLYNSLVVPHFDYGDIIWGGCKVKDSNKLQVTQNFAIKSITGAKKYDHASNSFEKLKFLKLKQRRKVHEVVFVHKALLGNLPDTICEKYIQQCPTSNNRSSTSAKLNLPAHKTSKYENSPFYRTISSWNDVPTTINTNTATKSFKKEYQRSLIKATYPQH